MAVRRNQLTLFTAEIPALGTAGPGGSKPTHPTSPDISLPWSQSVGRDGWSAKMFLHQLLTISRPHWTPSDTERLLSEWTARRLRASPARESSLSDVIKPAGKAFANAFKTQRTLRSCIRRHYNGGRCLHVFVRTLDDFPMVSFLFGSNTHPDCASWIVKSASASPVCLPAGLEAFIEKLAQGSQATP